MKIKIISVGKIKNKRIFQLCSTYKDRIKHFTKLEEVILKSGTNHSENEKIVNHLKHSKGLHFALSEDGNSFNSNDFANKLSSIIGQLSFVIGGTEGLNKEVKANCDEIISLSSMTFTHEMAQLFLLEQVYRAFTIKQNIKYHK